MAAIPAFDMQNTVDLKFGLSRIEHLAVEKLHPTQGSNQCLASSSSFAVSSLLSITKSARN
jgi:hypothetical protein